MPIYDLSYDMTTLLSPEEHNAMRKGVISQRKVWIKQQAHYYLEAGIDIEIKVIWHNKPYEAIIQEVIADKHDLLGSVQKSVSYLKLKKKRYDI